MVRPSKTYAYQSAYNRRYYQNRKLKKQYSELAEVKAPPRGLPPLPIKDFYYNDQDEPEETSQESQQEAPTNDADDLPATWYPV